MNIPVISACDPSGKCFPVPGSCEEALFMDSFVPDPIGFPYTMYDTGFREALRHIGGFVNVTEVGVLHTTRGLQGLVVLPVLR